MSILVQRPGLLTTVQDLGRRGWQQYGVVVGGAADALALRIANLLTGNEENVAGLEATLAGPQLEFTQDALVAVCGGDLAPNVNGSRLPMWRPVWIRKRSLLTFGNARTGCRAYLAVAGGIDVPLVLGSRGTYLRAKLGGLEGRALQTGDVLRVGSASPYAIAMSQRLKAEAEDRPFASVLWSAGSNLADYAAELVLRVIPGNELEWLTDESQAAFFHNSFQVSPQSDRMGYRLAGPKLELREERELISEAVCHGTVQVPPDGQPIILMSDCATTGGYPKAAHVATVDLPVLAQLKPGDPLRFQPVSVPQAQDLYRAREAMIEKLKVGIALHGGAGP